MFKLKSSFVILIIISYTLVVCAETEEVFQRDKRGIRDFIKGIFGHKTTTTTVSTEASSTSTTSTRQRFFGQTTTLINLVTSKDIVSEEEIQNDAFYKLKKYCRAHDDEFCIRKKTEIYDLVKKCVQIKALKHEEPQACKDIVSIYCYVFLHKDTSFCLTHKYAPYQPGVKSATTTKETARNTTTKYNPYTFKPYSYEPFTIRPFTLSPFTYRTIPIEVITKPVTQTTTSNKVAVTIPIHNTSKKLIVTLPTTQTTKSLSESNGGSPFGNGPIKNLPTDSIKLKEIGDYCLKSKGQDPNCDTALQMLKTKFKGCEKALKTDTECSDFKMNFCTAFSKFPCCPDVLAGRTCSGKSRARML